MDWLEQHGWTDGPLARSTDPPFSDIPIPIETYATFTSLFDPGGSASSYGTDYLATAVRSFFAQGGRRCYIVRMGDPVAPGDDAVAQNGLSGKGQKLAALLPGSLYAPDDRRSWHGVGHLGGLPDVSFLALPDLPALCASAPTAAAGVTVVVPAGPSQFVECSPPGAVAVPRPLYALPAPRLPTANTHGTGCSLSSAIAAGLAKSETLEQAVYSAKTWITAAIAAADRLGVGHGHGPIHHFHRFD